MKKIISLAFAIITFLVLLFLFTPNKTYAACFDKLPCGATEYNCTAAGAGCAAGWGDCCPSPTTTSDCNSCCSTTVTNTGCYSGIAGCGDPGDATRYWYETDCTGCVGCSSVSYGRYQCGCAGGGVTTTGGGGVTTTSNPGSCVPENNVCGFFGLTTGTCCTGSTCQGFFPMICTPNPTTTTTTVPTTSTTIPPGVTPTATPIPPTPTPLPSFTITGSVFIDTDKDGQKDVGEPCYSGVISSINYGLSGENSLANFTSSSVNGDTCNTYSITTTDRCHSLTISPPNNYAVTGWNGSDFTRTDFWTTSATAYVCGY